MFYNNVKKVVEGLGLEAKIVKVEDIENIINYGTMNTLALAVDGKVKFAGRVLPPDRLQEYLVK